MKNEDTIADRLYNAAEGALLPTSFIEQIAAELERIEKIAQDGVTVVAKKTAAKTTE